MAMGNQLLLLLLSTECLLDTLKETATTLQKYVRNQSTKTDEDQQRTRKEPTANEVLKISNGAISPIYVSWTALDFRKRFVVTRPTKALHQFWQIARHPTVPCSAFKKCCMAAERVSQTRKQRTAESEIVA